MTTFTITASHSAVASLTLCVDAETADEALEYAEIRFHEARGVDASEVIINTIDEAR